MLSVYSATYSVWFRHTYPVSVLVNMQLLSWIAYTTTAAASLPPIATNHDPIDLMEILVFIVSSAHHYST